MNEDALHNTVAQYLRLALPNDALFHHSPNGMGRIGWRSKMKLAKFGTMTGWPDVEIIYQGRTYFIELKAPGVQEGSRVKGKGYLNPDQRRCHDRLRGCGCPVAVCRSLEEVQETLWGWQIIEKRAA